MENNNSIVSREKIDQMATWVGSTVSSAFFSSLERFACVNVSTSDPDNDDHDDDDGANDRHFTVTNPTTDNVNGHHPNDVANLPVEVERMGEIRKESSHI
ncbi:UDP-N-acetylmuramate--L-alanine ligase [Quillaja saponaria]|uniref:UDP-N-acetylmuramate--L-alanine ligase n=1 Tax=Quillaja saponaria TaxID=32244 RepID=A0AAD7KSX2_QUISA|nr:UDP-N-acetylmuramate--L-alanine ligase [Quillaja saponaria]